MSIAAWIYDANVVLKRENLDEAYSRLKSSHKLSEAGENPDDFILAALKKNDNLAGFLEATCYKLKNLNDSIIIVDGDIDTISSDFYKLCESIAPFVEPGGIIEIRDEEGQATTVSFDGEVVSFEVDENFDDEEF